MTEDKPKEKNMISDLSRLNRYIFTRWSFIENRKLLLIWCNSIVVFYLLNLAAPNIGYGNFVFILSIIFLFVELGEILSRKKPKVEKTETQVKARTFKFGNRVFTTWRVKKDDDKTETNV